MVVTTGTRVVCAVIEHNDMVLAAHRKPDQTNGGLWEFPGGKVRVSEMLEAALTREITEELNVNLTIHRALQPVWWEYPWITVELFPFICSIADIRHPQPIDHAALRYVTPTEARSLPWAPADRCIVDQYFNG